jgi:hypothetical protein
MKKRNGFGDSIDTIVERAETMDKTTQPLYAIFAPLLGYLFSVS